MQKYETIMSELNIRKLTGIFFIVGAVLVNVPYTLLFVTFDYPDILRQPTAEILTKFHAGGDSLMYTWLAFAWVGLPILLGTVMLKRVLEKAEVTAVCSTRNLEMARSIGADQVIDYTKENFTQNGQRYDLIFAVNGYHPLSAYRHALHPRGNYVCVGGTLPQIFQSILLGPLVSKSEARRWVSWGLRKPIRMIWFIWENCSEQTKSYRSSKNVTH